MAKIADRPPHMISLDEALRLITEHAHRGRTLGPERVSLWAARGRVLAEDVMSPVDLPVADYSAMDGYAVRTDDFVQAGETSLSLVGQAQTGHPSAPLSPGGCVRIFTGAHIPPGADSVVMQENTTRTGDRITFLKAPQLGENIRRRGEDVTHGAQILTGGTRLSPHQLGLLASAERTEVVVRRRPRVAIVCTGDELRPFGNTFVGGQLAESNSVALCALCQDAGAEVLVSPLVKDDLESISAAIERAWAGADVVLTVGGVSVGDHDLVQPAIVRVGGEIIFHKVAIKPGKPVLFARRGEQLLLGLPGNPASAMVVFSLLGVPLLRCLTGDRSAAPRARTACLTHDYAHKPGRRSFYRALVVGDEVTVLSNQASGATTSMAWANALLEMSETTVNYVAGQRVPVWAFADL